MALNFKVALSFVLLALSIACSGRNDATTAAEAGRNTSFISERAYPFGAVADNARRLALNARYALTSSQAESGQFWSSIGPRPTVCLRNCARGQGMEFPTSGRVNAIAVSPIDPQIVLIGGGTGGIWRSTDGGDTFVPVTRDYPDPAVGSIAFSQSNPSIAYAGMGDSHSRGNPSQVYFGSGVLKSTDAGQSWTLISNTTLPAATVSKVVVDPANADWVYAAVRSFRAGNNAEFGGVWFSTDGGINWTRTLTGTSQDVAITPDSRTLYAGAFNGLHRSTDGGRRWQHLFEANRGQTFVAIAPGNPRTIYAALRDSAGLRMVMTNDGGATWSTKPAPPADLYSKMLEYVAVDPADAMTVYAGGLHLWKSTDGAESWVNISLRTAMENRNAPGLHVDQCAISFAPARSGLVYFANDGGLYRSTDRGRSFESLNKTLSLTQFYSIAVHPADPSLVFAGSQDNGPQRIIANSLEWQNLQGGDVGPIVIDPVDSDYVYYAGNFGFGIARYRSRGEIFDRVVSSSIVDPVTLMPAMAASRIGALYFGTWRLWTSTDRGDTWTPGTTDLTKDRGVTDAIRVIGSSKTDSAVIYTGSHQGRVMVSRNAGTTWTDITGTLPNRAITSIVTDTPNASSAFLSVSGFGSGHVFRSTDAGRSWTDVSGNLPDIPVNALLIDPDNPNTLYAGTDIGVFRSATGTTWTTFSSGLPSAAIVTGFAALPGGPIRLATYGHGAFQLKTTP